MTWLIYRQQIQVEKLQFKRELYDRRLAVYFSLLEYLSQVFREANVDINASIGFLRKTREAYFLFGKEVADYLNVVYNKSVELHGYNKRLHHADLPVGEERNRLAQEESELLKWLNHQMTDSREIFEKHLSLC